MLRQLKDEFRRMRFKYSLAMNKTPMASRDAKVYTDYLRIARKAFKRPSGYFAEMNPSIQDFATNGFTSFWTPESERLAREILAEIKSEESQGKEIWDSEWRYKTDRLLGRFPQLEQLFTGNLKKFLEGIYQSNFKIYFGVIYKSVRDRPKAWGSQLWHSDGGPGTCTNLMFCLSEVHAKNGAMECLPWKYSKAIQNKNRIAYLRHIAEKKIDERTFPRLELREIKTELNRIEIQETCADEVRQPSGRAGMILPFRNNILHKGGFPDEGHERYVFVFHIYPAVQALPFEKYRASGLSKGEPYPKDPAFLDEGTPSPS